AGERQREEEIDAAFQVNQGGVEGAGDFFGSAFDGGGIGNAPVSSHGMAGPDGADFTGSVVANRDNEIEFGRIGFGEFVPGFAPEAKAGQSGGFELTKRGGMDVAFGMTARAEGGEGGKSFFVEDGFGKDGTGGISGTEKEDVVV